jgi:hypothetical protein
LHQIVYRWCKTLIRWYILPTSRCSATRQLATTAPFRKQKDPMYQEAAPGKRKALDERKRFVGDFRPKYKELAGVANFYNLALDADDLNDVIAALEAKGAVIFEAATQRRSDDPKALRAMYAEAAQVYDGKTLTTAEATELGRKRAATWDRAKPRPGRMPFAEAQVYLSNLSLSVDDAIKAINRVSRERIGPEKKKRYPMLWNRDFAYRSRDKNLISFPNRAVGRPRKPKL